ncbi:hypothetical protein CSA56_03020 [candidate division KSB3 bacterium]|uniref:Uncharacterized protein n=1 Tax=candidate division KSB3 bacterium TaxID=2044937 RepID=A0A2G6KJA6_9BACT|nr:MAG: hypothetical protein CSA56_03020 [candidate division KSB3 bacterium]
MILIQAITIADHACENHKDSVDCIKRNISPGNYIPLENNPARVSNPGWVDLVFIMTAERPAHMTTSAKDTVVTNSRTRYNTLIKHTGTKHTKNL